MTALRTAVVGIGSMSRGHLQAVETLEEYTLSAVCDLREEALRPYTDRPEVKSFTSFDAMMEEVKPEVVILVTPDAVHADLTCKAAAYAPKAIVSEKPMSLHFADAVKMVRVCEQNGVELLINHQRRLVAGKTMREAVASGALGDLLELEGRCAGDLIGDGTHLVDTLTAIGGDEPALKVWGMLDTGHTDGVMEQRYGRAKERSAAAFWSTASNRRYSVQTGELANRIPYHSIRVLGTKGEMWHPGGHTQPGVFVRDGKPGTHVAALGNDGWFFLPEEKEGGDWRLINPEDDLSRAMSMSLSLLSRRLQGEDVAHPLSGKRTLQVQEILNAAYIAAVQNCAVTLPLSEDTQFPL